MLRILLTFILAWVPALALAESLGTVRITHPVLAGGKPLQPGTYELRLTTEPVTPLPGQTPGAERWVEIVSNGAVVAREAAVVVSDEGSAVGTSSASATSRPRVELLKGGDFLRVSTRRGAERYLIHFPVAPGH